MQAKPSEGQRSRGLGSGIEGSDVVGSGTLGIGFQIPVVIGMFYKLFNFRKFYLVVNELFSTPRRGNSP